MYYRHTNHVQAYCRHTYQTYPRAYPPIHPIIHSSTHTTFNTHRVRLNQPALVPIQSAPIDILGVAFAMRLVRLVLVVLVVRLVLVVIVVLLVVLVAALEG